MQITCPNHHTKEKHEHANTLQSNLKTWLAGPGRSPSNLPEWVGARKCPKYRFECVIKRNKFRASHNAIMIYVLISARRESPWVRSLQYGIRVWRSQVAYLSHYEPVPIRRISQSVSSLKTETGDCVENEAMTELHNQNLMQGKMDKISCTRIPHN